MSAVAPRTTFSTSRLLEFCSRKELTAQTGHEPDDWPLVIVKELIDNALDIAEEAGIAPVVCVTVARGRIRVRDNGPSIPPETATSILNFATRTSSRRTAQYRHDQRHVREWHQAQKADHRRQEVVSWVWRYSLRRPAGEMPGSQGGLVMRRRAWSHMRAIRSFLWRASGWWLGAAIAAAAVGLLAYGANVAAVRF
jgi:hypothetical protein